MSHELIERLSAIVLSSSNAKRSSYLSRDDLAKEFNIDKRTLRELETLHGLPIHHLGGNTFRFLRSEVDAWVAAKSATKESV